MDKESEERKSDQLVGQILHKVDKFKEFLQENSPFIDDSHTEFLAGAIGILSVLCLIMLYIQCSKKVINYKTAEPSARISYKRRLLRSFKKHKNYGTVRRPHEELTYEERKRFLLKKVP